MEIAEAQEWVTRYNDAREWLTVKADVKDLLMNMCEESGEAWNLIKWVDNEKQRELFAKQKEEWLDFVGDQLFLIFKIAAMTGVDAEKGFRMSMDDYEKRFPVAIVKGKHANLHAGGYDGKYMRTDDTTGSKQHR